MNPMHEFGVKQYPYNVGVRSAVGKILRFTVFSMLSLLIPQEVFFDSYNLRQKAPPPNQSQLLPKEQKPNFFQFVK